MLWLEAVAIWSKQYDALNASQRKTFENAIADNEFNGERYIKANDITIQKLLIHYYNGVKLLDLLKHLKQHRPMLFDMTRFFILDNIPVLAVNIELIEKHKRGEIEINELLEMLLKPLLVMAG